MSDANAAEDDAPEMSRTYRGYMFTYAYIWLQRSLQSQQEEAENRNATNICGVSNTGQIVSSSLFFGVVCDQLLLTLFL